MQVKVSNFVLRVPEDCVIHQVQLKLQSFCCYQHNCCTGISWDIVIVHQSTIKRKNIQGGFYNCPFDWQGHTRLSDSLFCFLRCWFCGKITRMFFYWSLNYLPLQSSPSLNETWERAEIDILTKTVNLSYLFFRLYSFQFLITAAL